MNKLASWETLTGTRPTIESDRTIATVSFPLKCAIQRKTESRNVAINVPSNPDVAKKDTKNVPVNTDDGKNVPVNTDGAKNGAKTTPRQDAILELMVNHPEITLDEIAKEIGVGTATIDREIAKMAHLVQRKGPKKGGYWIIIDTT